MLYRLSFLSLMVSMLLGTSLMSVTTAAAQTTANAPGQCEWPVTGTVLTADGSFSSDITGGIGSGWANYDPARRVPVVGHPCGYEWAYSQVGVQLKGNVNQVPDKWLLVSYWIRVEPTHFAEAFAMRGFLDGGIEAESGTVIPGNEWYFHTTCLPPSTREGETAFTVIPSGSGGMGSDPMIITGLSAKVGETCDTSPAPSPTASPTPENTTTPIPTASPTAVLTPSQTITPTTPPTAVPTATPTPIPTLTPLPAPTKLPELQLTAVPTIPASVRDLPVLPGPLPVSPPPVDMSDMPMPEIGMDDGIYIIQIVRTVTNGLAESQAWTMIRYLAYAFLSVTLLGKLIF